MNLLRMSMSFALAVVVAVGLTSPTAAGEQVRFEGRLEGTATVSPLVPPFVGVEVEAAGQSTQLGRFAVEIPHVVDRSDFTACGRYIFTAANGDEVYAKFEGYSMPTDTPNVIAIVENATITGGTGRFAGATGSFTTLRLFDRVTGATIGAFNGTISSPGN